MKVSKYGIFFSSFRTQATDMQNAFCPLMGIVMVVAEEFLFHGIKYINLLGNVVIKQLFSARRLKIIIID